MAPVTKDQAIAKLLAAHKAWYNVFENFEYAGRTFPGYAEFHSHGEQYALVKRAKLWEVEAHDYLFLDAVDRLDASALNDYVAFMTTDAVKLPKPKPDHMQSSLSLTVVADGVDADVRKTIGKTRFHKSYKHGIWGYSDLRLAVATVITVVLGIALGLGGYSVIWPLFGAANQLLAALALLAVCAWLGNAGKNNKMFYFPMVFMLIVTLTSLVLTMQQKIAALSAGFAFAPFLQLAIAVLLFVLAVILAVKGGKIVFGKKQDA